MENIIEVRNLRKTFGKLEVLKGISCSFKRSQAVCVLGPNASGKTTLIKSILGMVIPDEGEIFFNSKPVINTFDYKKDIGYMPQIGNYPENMKIGQLFEMMMDIRAMHAGLDTDLLKAFNLENMYGKAMRTLSGGTRQKVSAALAFMFNPSVLVLDEPTAGLDPLAAEILKEKILVEKDKGKLILVTSHIMSEVEEIADQVLYLTDGIIKFYKALESLKAETGEQRLGKALTKII
ncbi:ABC transporter ATP-binding protein [Rubrolithibacter danxiaensis]|uniref:ABC transporter ATP-binding protein n=1 Tax=Rubrolithibacter danxiaensis TaxID=3390805 RepID=UPI003BF8D9C4